MNVEEIFENQTAKRIVSPLLKALKAEAESLLSRWSLQGFHKATRFC